jgi:hypothetical protein
VLGPDHLGYFALTLLFAPLEGQSVVVAQQMDRHALRDHLPHARHAVHAGGRDPADRSGGASDFSFHHPGALTSAPSLPKL